MSNEINYRIDYGTVNPAGPASRSDPDAPLFASEDGVVASLSNNECIFQMRRTGDTHVMTYQVLQAGRPQCREFRPLDEHVARVQTTIPGLQAHRDGVRRVLESLGARGLLVSDADFLRRLAAAPAVETPTLRAVFIRACDRPAQLERLLKSLAECERRFRTTRRYVLIDDSVSSDAANRHRDLLREFARATGCKLTYLGIAEQTRFVERLAKAVPQAARVLPSMLVRSPMPAAFGGGRGWKSRAAAFRRRGASSCCSTTINVCRSVAPTVRARVSIPIRRRWHSRVSTATSKTLSAPARNSSTIRSSCILRSSVAASARCSPTQRYAIDRKALRGLGLGRLDHLRGDANVIATRQGAYGSSRTESGAWLYQLDPESRAEFWADRESYLRNVEAGSLWYGQRQARATTTGMFTPFALDNQRLLPCTNPLGRGEDALFAQIAHLCHPDALSVELPVAIGHAQENARRRSDKTLAAPPPRFNYFVTDFVQRQLSEFLAEDPAARLGLLAANLRDVAGASDARRLRTLREYLAYVRADSIERLQQQYESAQNAPIYWQADVRSIIEANGRALTAKSAPRLADWPDTLDESGCATMLRDETARLAAGYEAWPALWAYAREQGERLLGAL